ncbi:MAG TPA: cytochrome P450 [Pseudonocardiaceae bacterium]|nr:cytochrome P450 [Pseudonocardiaceae bacterium]
MTPDTGGRNLAGVTDVGQVDLADPATFALPGLESVWRLFRESAPVYRHPETRFGPPFWVLTRHADVLAVLKDAERFSSRRGNMLTSLLTGGDTAGGKLLAVTDAPRHSAVRLQLLRSFSPRVLRQIADGVRARAEKLVTAAVWSGDSDFAHDVADQLPIGTICDLLGAPQADQAELLRLSKQALSSDQAHQSPKQVWLARNQLLVYFTDLCRHYRAEPEDNVVTALINCRIDGEPLTEEEIVLNCYGLVLAGDETSRLAMTAAVLNFATFPDQWRALRDGHADLATAVDEILRWNSPALHLGRTAVTDVTIGDATIRAGDIVTVWLPSANRDDAVFTDPDTLNLNRNPNRHLAFGFGPHFCLGAYLGRTEVTAVVDALRRTAHDVQLRGGPEPIYSTFLRGYSSLPVTFTAQRDPDWSTR